jgi:EAL domain-containing protein (putative c-di-GMP-specific phosphodiesterase class I)
MNQFLTSAQLACKDNELSSAPALDQISAAMRDADGYRTAAFGDLTLYSHFQPVFSLAHSRIVGYEALVRGAYPDGRPCSPLEIFASASNQFETVLLDRLCRAVHMHNFMGTPTGNEWLFLNVNPQVIVDGKRYGSFFEDLLKRIALPSHRIVIEILEAELADESKLVDATQYYRNLGCLIAIDDFGAGHSNFDRIWRLQPDIVKLDRSIIVQAAESRHIRNIIPGMVSLLHEAGSLVVMEGIETRDQAMIAMDADADFVQGYYFGRPVPPAAIKPGSSPIVSSLFDRFKQTIAEERANHNRATAPYLNGIGSASTMLTAGQTPELACQTFLQLPRAERCYLLDANGLQIGYSVVNDSPQETADPRYAPLHDAQGANWSRRYYFRRAIAQPEKVHVTRPYLSTANANPCVTASIAFRIDGVLRVLCGDIAWPPLSGIA